jgi:hypothetical protein
LRPGRGNDQQSERDADRDSLHRFA